MEGMPPSTLSEIAKLGAPGVLLLFMSWISWTLLKRNNALSDGRVVDWKALSEIISGNNVTMNALIASSDARTRSAEAISRAQELAAAAQLTLTQEVVRLREQNEELRMEIQKLRDVILQMRERGSGHA